MRIIAIEQENRGLKDSLAKLQGQLRAAQEQVRVLRDGSNRSWFMTGAGVLLGGMFLGLIIPKIRWQPGVSPHPLSAPCPEFTFP